MIEFCQKLKFELKDGVPLGWILAWVFGIAVSCRSGVWLAMPLVANKSDIISPPKWALIRHVKMGLSLYDMMPHYGHVCHFNTSILAPINFWQISDQFKRWKHSSSSKLTKLEQFKGNIWNFQRKYPKYKTLELLWWFEFRIKHTIVTDSSVPPPHVFSYIVYSSHRRSGQIKKIIL